MKTKTALFSTKHIFYTLCCLVAVLVVSYGFLVNKTILNVVARQKAQSQIASLTAQTNTLETTYLALENNITLDLAYSEGFKDVARTQFLVQNQGLQGFSIR